MKVLVILSVLFLLVAPTAEASLGKSHWTGSEEEILDQVRERFLIERHPELIAALDRQDRTLPLETRLTELALLVAEDNGKTYRPFLLRRLLYTAAEESDNGARQTVATARKLAAENLPRLSEITAAEEADPGFIGEPNPAEKRREFLHMRIEVTANILALHGERQDLPVFQKYADCADETVKHFGEMGAKILMKRLAE